MSAFDVESGRSRRSVDALSVAVEASQARAYPFRQWARGHRSPLLEWLSRIAIKPVQINPGSPWENGYNERFNGTLRKILRDAERLSTTNHPQIIISQRLRQYNHVRPHQALDMRPPVPETSKKKWPIAWEIYSVSIREQKMICSIRFLFVCARSEGQCFEAFFDRCPRFRGCWQGHTSLFSQCKSDQTYAGRKFSHSQMFCARSIRLSNEGPSRVLQK